jgi:hypothetical protein
MSNDRKRIGFVTALVAVSILLVALPSSLSGQELDGIPEHVVKVALNPKSTVIYSGIMQKQLTPMGDAAAVAVTKVLAEGPPNAEIVDRILLVIEISFESPEAILNQADQKPKTALFVLRFLDQRTLGTEQRNRLLQLKKKLRMLT